MAPEPNPVEEDRTYRGILRRQIYQSLDQNYTVAELETEPDSRALVVAGNLGGCQVGDTMEVLGRLLVHGKYGPQVRVKVARWIPPVSAAGMQRFLAGGAVEGIGKALAKRIVDHFGEDTVRVLDEQPERLSEVDGIGAGRAGAVASAWARCRRLFEEAAFLAGLGLGPAMTARVQESLGADAVSQVRRDPYLLSKVVEGIGFKRADEIARRLDVASDAPERIRAGLRQVLVQGTEQGHLYLLRSDVVREAVALLSLPPGPIEDRLADEIEHGTLKREAVDGDEALYLPDLYRAELEVAEELRRRLGPPLESMRVDAAGAVQWVGPRLGLPLTDDQRAALELLFQHRLSILTGGPGVGKTTIVRALAEVFLAKGQSVALAAPTGRASRRLEEASGHPASTIHRLLKYNPHRHRFDHGRDNPLLVDVLMVDEASMIDLPLMRDLLRALPRESRLILVGDADQLPSVGPGDLLRSMVESGVVPTARLRQILRQREGSSIVRAAHAVLRGAEPEFQRTPGEGAFLMTRDNPEAAQQAVIDMVTRRLPEHYGLDPMRDVQVLAPMHRGPLGTRELNRRIQETLNPIGQDDVGVGDRVIQLRNNYDLGVFNGEIGHVQARDVQKGEITVSFEGRPVTFTGAEARHLALAYAISVHKSQGCEFPAVVLVLSMQHFVMLRRNLLYTAITRARQVLVVVAAARALRRAVEMGTIERRHSLLERRLQSPSQEPLALEDAAGDAAGGAGDGAGA